MERDEYGPEPRGPSWRQAMGRGGRSRIVRRGGRSLRLNQCVRDDGCAMDEHVVDRDFVSKFKYYSGEKNRIKYNNNNSNNNNQSSQQQ